MFISLILLWLTVLNYFRHGPTAPIRIHNTYDHDANLDINAYRRLTIQIGPSPSILFTGYRIILQGTDGHEDISGFGYPTMLTSS